MTSSSFPHAIGLRTAKLSSTSQAITLVISIAIWCYATDMSGQAISFAGSESTLASGFAANSGLPTNLAVDKAGDVFIADTGHARVVEIPAGSGGQTIPLGSSFTFSTPTGVAVDAAGNVYVADPGLGKVVEIPLSGTPQALTLTGLTSPVAVAVDQGSDLFIADQGGNGTPASVFEWSSGSLTTLGSGFQFASPTGIAVDSAGDVYVADPGVPSLVKIANGTAQTVAVTGLTKPVAVALDAAGDLFIADEQSVTVVEMPAGGGAPTSVPLAGLASSLGVGVDQKGNVLIADTATDNQVVKVQIGSANFGSVNVGSSSMMTLIYNINSMVSVSGVNVLTEGTPNLDFTSSGASSCAGTPAVGTTCGVLVSLKPGAPGARMGAVEIIGPANTLQATTLTYGVGVASQVAFASAPQTTMTAPNPVAGVAVDAAGDLFFSQLNTNAVIEQPAGGAAQNTLASSGLSSPNGLAVDGAGNLFIANGGDGSISELSPGSSMPTNSQLGLSNLNGIAVDGPGDLFLSAVGVQELRSGTSTPVAVPFTGLGSSSGVAVDGSGDVFAADSINWQLLELPGNGGPQVAVSGFGQPFGVAVDAAGDFYTADNKNGVVIELPVGCSSSTCELTLATISAPTGLALDASGDVFIVASNSNQIVEVQGSQASPLSFGAVAVDTTSPALIVTLGNIGNAPLTFSTITASTSFATDPNTTTCSSPVGPGGTCNVGVVCAPTTALPLTGTLTITDNALNASAATQTVSLSCTGLLQTQTITFTTPPPASAVYNTGFVVAATGGASGNPVVFSSSGACTNSGASYTMTSGTGTCSVTATQAGDTTHAAAQVTLSTAAVPATDTVTFTVDAPATAAYASSFTVSATGGGSSNPVIYESNGQCSNVGPTYTMVNGAGPCNVTIFQFGDSNYSNGTTTEVTNATLASQTITFTSNAPSSAVYGGTFTVQATGGASGNPVIFTSAGACSNIGPNYTMTSGTGTCSVIANQAGPTPWAMHHYANASTVTEMTTATLASQTLAFTTNAPASAVYLSSFTVAAHASSGLAAVFTSSGACSNSGATYTMTSGTGTCSVTVSQPGNSNYAAATPVAESTNATSASQSITFSTNPPTSAVYGASFTVVATASSGLPIAFASAGSCSNSGATYTMTSGTGTCSVIANQSGNGNYSAASQVTKSSTAQKAAATVSINNIPASGTAGGNFSPTYTTNSNGATSVTSSTTSICSVSGNTVSFRAAGTCSLVAHTSSTSNYNAGTGASQSFTIIAATITSISPNSGLRGTSFLVTLAGAHLSGATAVTVSGTGVAASGITVLNDSTVTATFTVSASASTSTRTVTVTTPIGNTNTLTFTVTGPTLTSISPTSGTHGTAVMVTLNGTNLSGATGINVSGSGITVSGLAASGSRVTATFTIAGTAQLSTRTVSVNTPIGTTGSVSFTVK